MKVKLSGPVGSEMKESGALEILTLHFDAVKPKQCHGLENMQMSAFLLCALTGQQTSPDFCHKTMTWYDHMTVIFHKTEAPG